MISRSWARPAPVILQLALGAVALASTRADADEGGVSFWTPGSYGSLAAIPAVPGWSFSTFNYYDSVSAGKSAEFVRGGGVDARLDWRASQFLSASLQIGAVGYVYDQITGDSGSGANLGPFESRVIGVGPPIGYIFPSPAYRAM